MVRTASRSTRTGVTPSPERDPGHACFISCEDPDGIQIELWNPKP